MTQTTINYHEDEFCLIRIRDGARIVSRLFLTDNGFGSPWDASVGYNSNLAQTVNGRLESEKNGKVSFGKGV